MAMRKYKATFIYDNSNASPCHAVKVRNHLRLEATRPQNIAPCSAQDIFQAEFKT